ncbi:MAG: signal peptidase I [Promethearchaeota archaeon]
MYAGFYGLKFALRTDIPIVVVTSGSMEPQIHKGDILFIKHVNGADIVAGDHVNHTGDVIVYDTHGVWPIPIDDPVVHRVIDKKYENGKYWFKTQGDANILPDEGWIPEENVYGKVVATIPYIGYVKLFLDETRLTIPLIILFGGLLTLSVVCDTMGKKKKEKADSSANPEKERNDEDT